VVTDRSNHMPDEFACPRCGGPITTKTPTCPKCGINLTLATIMASEEAFLASQAETSAAPLTPEVLVPRLGEILLEKNLISQPELQHALDIHRQLAENGKPRLLGQVLVALKLIDQERLDQVITHQIIQLQTALQRANLLLEQRVRERTQELQSALDRLSELNRMKLNFISNISHELRTPLTHMKGYLDLMLEGTFGTLTSEQIDAVRVITHAENRLEQLIEDLIRFSLAVRGEMPLSIKPADLTGLISSAIHQASKQASAKNIDLRASIPKNMPSVDADVEKISWVLKQLIDNGIKFTRSGGQVIVEVEKNNTAVVVSVTDTGIGIPPERLNEIFEPFHQLDSSDTRRYGGTGLGLALVRRIIEAHGSIIKVQSQVDIGSRFEFSLSPAKPNPD